MENNTYVEEYGKRFNDEGEEVPEVCDKCGSNIGVYLKGEPVYLCSDCKKYFGTVPCNVKESFIMGEDFSYCDDFYNKPDNYYTESDLQPAIRESLELIKSSVTSKYFPDEFADYSSSMYFREELKNFIKHATVVVQSKNGPMPEGLHHLWILAKAAVDYDEYKKYMDKHEESLRLAESQVKHCERAINEYDSSNNKGQKNIDSLKIDLDQAIRYREYVMRDTNWSYHKSLVIRSISRILSYGCVKESFEDVFGPVIQETYQPYDEYLKLHQYDPKTNTIVINGKRMNAGIVGSNKQRNRMNKFLRENNYNPKDGTIETSIDENGTKKRVEFNIDPHDTGSMNQYVLVDRTTGKAIKKDFDISMSPKSMSNKPGISNQTKEHETGHGDMYLNPEKYKQQLQDSNTHNQAKKAAGNYRGGNPAQVRHAMNPEENVADLYAAKNNKYGQSWGNSNYGRMIENERRNRIQTERQDVKKDIAYNQKKYQYYVDKENKNGTLSEDEEDLKNYYKRMADAVPDRKTIVNNATNGTEMRSFRNEMNSRKEFVDKNLNQNNQGNNQNQSQNTPPPPPIKESFEEMFGPVIQEAFDAVTGEEIPIEKAYTMDEMKRITFSESELKHIKHDDELVSVKRPNEDEVYFGSPTNYMPEIDLDGPLFVTPHKGLASIYVGRDIVKSKIPRGNYNLQYEEWGKLGEVDKPLSDVHVYVEGYPFLEQIVVEGEGYIHCVKVKYYSDNFYRYPWMNNREYLIAKTDNMKVEFTRSIKCKVKYHIKGRPSPKGKQYGPSKGGILQYIHDIADKIHAKYKADQKEPTGNQNCLLCAWCAEASIRGGDYLPRPVYSPRDPALEIVPGDIVGGVAKKNPRNFHDMLAHLRKDSIGQPFARWYCHVKWSQSNGGHEFLIVKIDENAFNIMDPQQGIVRPLTADDSYMKNVDWEGTYICRIDDKPFKYMKLDQINDPKKTLPWDPKKDIPYMVKHGMCTKEEAENELKNAETNLFTSELKKSLKQTHIQESASDPMTIIPKDLRDWLKKGDYSSLEKDDSYYYVEGRPVEEFWRDPEFVRSAFYLDDKNDPSYNSIVFSDDNGNGLIYDPTDGWYYYLYHDWTEDDTGFLHRERLSSKSWTQIIEPHKLGQKTGSEITKVIPKERVYYRFEYEGEGIYDAYKHHAPWLQWHEFKQTYAASWLNVVPNYRSGEKSYFTEEGYAMFMEHTYPEMIKVLDESKIEEIRVNLKPEDIRYEDKYQATTKAGVPEPKPIQETALPEGLYLRRARESDLTNIIQWKLDSVNPETRNDPKTIAFIENDAKENLKDTKMIMYNDDLIGVLESCYIDNGEWWYIGEIYLIPEYRGRGFGRAILQREIDSRDKIKLRVSKDNTHAIDLYKSLGFGISEEDEYAYTMTLVKNETIQESESSSEKFDKVLSACKDLYKEWSKYDYGIPVGGRIQNIPSASYFDKNYRFLSPEEFKRVGGGVCWDYVEFGAKFLNERGVKYKQLYIITDTPPNYETHTIIVCEVEHRVIYVESSFKKIADELGGVGIFNSIEEVVEYITSVMFELNGNDKCFDKFTYDVIEFTSVPKYGSSCQQYMQWMQDHGEIIYQGLAYPRNKNSGKTIQEGAWNDIHNGVNPWSDKLIFHISPEGYLDGQVFKPRVPAYLDKYDPTQPNFEDVDNPRVCFSTSIEGALNAILVNIGRWKTAEKLNNWYVYIPEKPLKEYKHSTNKNIIRDKKVFDANLTKEIWIEEPVRLKQYGIIRVDQVKSVARRKTVPTINGEKGDRNYYSFKWHWLVRPNVLKDIPYDYSPIAVCNNMLDDISKFKYGLGYGGSIHHGSSKDFDEKYRFESPEEFEKNGGGICFDYVEWQAGYLEAYGYTCRKFYISTDTRDGDTHTFILVDDGKGGFIYPEAAFELMRGVYKVKSPEEAVLKVMDRIFDINDNDKKYDEIKYYVWEYKGHPPYGSTMKEATEYFSKGEPFHEGTATKIKRKD